MNRAAEARWDEYYSAAVAALHLSHASGDKFPKGGTAEGA